jgi:hypothetical protein
MGDRKMAEGNYSRFLTEGLSDIVIREADDIIKKISRILPCYIDLRYIPDQKELIDYRGKSHYIYFRKIKQHQIELLIQITEDIEIIKSLIDQTFHLSSLVYAHSRALVEATWVNGAIKERIEQRPMAIENVKNIDASDLNSSYAVAGEIPAADQAMDFSGSPIAEKLFHCCYELIRETFDDIEHRGVTMQANIQELKNGWTLFKRLIRHKLTRRIKNALDIMIHKHDDRILLFKETVKAYRVQQFPGKTGNATIHWY